MPIERSYRDEIGREREYEMILILTPDIPQNRLRETIDRVMEIIEKRFGSRVLLLETWGKRKLAYTIKKRKEGIYYYWRFLGHGELVAEIEKYLRMSEFVLRFFALKLEDNVDPAARPSDVTPEVVKRAADFDYIAQQTAPKEVEEKPEAKEEEKPAEAEAKQEVVTETKEETAAEASSEETGEKEE